MASSRAGRAAENTFPPSPCGAAEVCRLRPSKVFIRSAMAAYADSYHTWLYTYAHNFGSHFKLPYGFIFGTLGKALCIFYIHRVPNKQR